MSTTLHIPAVVEAVLPTSAVTPAAVDEVVKTGTIKYSALGTKHAQAAINGMDTILKQFAKVAQEANAEEAEAYRAAYNSVCKMAGTSSSKSRASECNRIFHAFKVQKAETLALIASGLGYHAVIGKLPSVKASGKPKTDKTGSSVTAINEGKAKSKSADTALAEIFTDMKLIKVDAGTAKALLNAVLGLMEQSKDEYLTGLADDLSASWEAYEELHSEVVELEEIAKAA